MIKIYHFISDTNIGGAGNLLCNQIKNMEGSDFDITVVLPHGSLLREKMSALPCRTVETRHGADRSFSAGSVIEDYAILKRARPDIVHSHASLSSRIAAAALKIPTRIHTRHCVFPLSPLISNPIGRGVCGAINNALSTKMIAVAESAKKNLVEMGCKAGKIETVINGSDAIRRLDGSERARIKESLSLSKDHFTVGIFARLEAYKGHKTLIDAARICKKYCPDMRFLIVGEGSFRAELEEYARRRGVDDIICFSGFVSDVAPFFNVTDVNVNCSYGTETSSLAISEGMSLGIPAVVSDYGGNPFMVKNGEEGFIFPVGNHESLAVCLVRLYRDRALYKKMSQNAETRYIKDFTAKAMSDRMARIYRDEYAKNRK